MDKGMWLKELFFGMFVIVNSMQAQGPSVLLAPW
jgi:hypothetical protein